MNSAALLCLGCVLYFHTHMCTHRYPPLSQRTDCCVCMRPSIPTSSRGQQRPFTPFLCRATFCMQEDCRLGEPGRARLGRKEKDRGGERDTRTPWLLQKMADLRSTHVHSLYVCGHLIVNLHLCCVWAYIRFLCEGVSTPCVQILSLAPVWLFITCVCLFCRCIYTCYFYQG